MENISNGHVASWLVAFLKSDAADPFAMERSSLQPKAVTESHAYWTCAAAKQPASEVDVKVKRGRGNGETTTCHAHSDVYPLFSTDRDSLVKTIDDSACCRCASRGMEIDGSVRGR